MPVARLQNRLELTLTLRYICSCLPISPAVILSIFSSLCNHGKLDLTVPPPPATQKHVLTVSQSKSGYAPHLTSRIVHHTPKNAATCPVQMPPTDTRAFTRVSVSPECISKFNELKLGKSVKYIIYKLSDDYKEIVVEDSSSDPDWETFQNKLLDAKAGHKGKVGKGPRYAVYDFQYELEGGEGTRYAVTTRQNEPERGSEADKRTGTRLSSSRGAQTREHWSS